MLTFKYIIQALLKKTSIFALALLLASKLSYAQKNQRIAYLDMEYILQNIPEYVEAQNALNSKVEKWKNKLAKEARSIEILKTDLVNEKAILTKELIDEREEDINVKQEALRRLESLYFGPNGDLFNLRKQLVQPVQDKVYNAVQEIASKKNLDFVFDKSSDLVMLYYNKKYDISDLIVKLIKIDQKQETKKQKIVAKKALLKNEPTEKQKQKEAKIKEIEEKRKARLKVQAEKRELLKEKREAYKKAQQEKRKPQQEK
ncbi:MAG: OmpH family outer membrane protein [Tenacibaculum sp.]